MEDIYFSRIGLAFHHILSVVELPAHIQAEVKALAVELQNFEGSVNGLIDQRVQARIDQIDGVALGGVNEMKAKFEALEARVTSVEGGLEGLADILDTPATPPPAEETTTAAPAGDDTVAGAAGDDSVAAAEGADSTSGADTASGTDSASAADSTTTAAAPNKKKSTSN